MKRNDVLSGGLVIVALLGAGLVVMAVMAAVLLGGSGDSGGSTNPPDTFTEVRNTCGLCGTDSPVGGWEAEDGRALVLRENGEYSALLPDGTTAAGTWFVGATRLCLSPDTGGQTCFEREQKMDAMKLDDAIYIRR